MAIVNKSTNNKFGKDMEKGEPFYTVGGNADWWSHCGKQYGDTPKIKNGSASRPSDIPLLVIYPVESQTLILKNICTPMFIATLFTIAKIWQQPKCPSVDESG